VPLDVTLDFTKAWWASFGKERSPILKSHRVKLAPPPTDGPEYPFSEGTLVLHSRRWGKLFTGGDQKIGERSFPKEPHQRLFVKSQGHIQRHIEYKLSLDDL